MSLKRAAFILCFCWLLLSWSWLSGAMQIPYDAKGHWYPHLSFLAQSLANGQSPFWTPNIFAGSPEIADPQSALFSWPLLILASLSANPSPFMMDKMVFLAILFAGICVLKLFKERQWHLEGGLIAALAFMFGASMAWRIQHINMVFSLALLPLTLILLDRAFARLSLTYGVLAGLVAAFILIDRDQVSLLIIYWLFFYTLYRLFKHQTPLSCLPFLSLASITAIVVIALPVLLTLFWGNLSNRPQIDVTEAGKGSLHPINLITLVIGNLFGAAGDSLKHWGTPSYYWGDTGLFLARNMSVLYLGALPCFALLLSFWRGDLWREHRFMIVSILCVFFYSIGWYSPIFNIMYEIMPLVKAFRRPADATFLLGGLLALLSGIAWNVVREKIPTKREGLMLGAFIIAVFMLGLGLALDKKTLSFAWPNLLNSLILWVFLGLALMKARILLIPLLVLDLFMINGSSESTALPPKFFERLNKDTQDEAIRYLKANLKPLERVELRGLGYFGQNLGLIHGFHDVLGFNPLREGEYSKALGTHDIASLHEQRDFPPTFEDYDSPLARLLGLKYIVTAQALENKTPIFQNKDNFIYESEKPLPRVIFAHKIVDTDFADLIKTGDWPEIDYANTVLLEREAPERKEGTAQVLDYQNTKITVKVNSPEGGIVVLHDVFHPSWVAHLGEKTLPIERANLLFRGVEVPAGEHIIIFTYEPVKGLFHEISRFKQ